MAETSFKDRILGIIFEPEPDENDTEKPKKAPNDAPRLKAEDLLYGKNKDKDDMEEPKERPVHNNSTFINYKPENSPRPEPEPAYHEYVSSPNISPIFGPIETEKKGKKKETVSVDYASVEKPGNSPLGMVMSPIYGYDTRKANEERSKMQSEEKEEETIVDFDITEDLGDIFGSDEFKQEANEEEEQNYTEEIDLFSDFYTEDK
ncbi:MAG: hypothetical protein IJJ00_03300 [Erysipelotrichaceae bacterium]|nr:hypothetical protein [Erysipelotrichaceae bacterium]